MQIKGEVKDCPFKYIERKGQVRVGKYMLTFPVFPLQKIEYVEVIAKSEGSISLIPLLESVLSKVASSQLEQRQQKKKSSRGLLVFL